MDDLIVIGCSEKHMLKNLTDVFEKCRKYNLKIHPEKFSFFMHQELSQREKVISVQQSSNQLQFTGEYYIFDHIIMEITLQLKHIIYIFNDKSEIQTDTYEARVRRV